MNIWTKSEFQLVSKKTRLSSRTLAACEEVLIDGVAGIDAAAKHQIFPSSLSRALGVLNDKREALQNSILKQSSNENILRMTVGEMAKNLLGEDLPIKEAVSGQAYEGPVIVNAHGYVVQKVGRIGVIHDLRNLSGIPPRSIGLSISYEKTGTLGEISVVEKQQAKSIER